MDINHIIIIINKMDLINYDQNIFQKVCSIIDELLINNGVSKEQMEYIPLSGWEGENLIRKSTEMGWYSGRNLLEAIDNIKIPKRKISNQPLRIILHDTYRIQGIGFVPCGKIVSGWVQASTKLTFFTGIQNAFRGVEVKSIEKGFKPVKYAFPGDNIGINLILC